MAIQTTHGQFVVALLAIYITVAFAQDILQMNPDVLKLPVIEKSRQVLDCYYPSPHGSLSWTTTPSNLIGMVNINNTRDSNGTLHSFLTIDSYADVHDGDYICTYTPTGSSSGQISERPISLLGITESKTDGVFTFRKQSETLACSVHLGVNEEAPYEWLQDNKSISQLNDKRFTTFGNGTLLITKPIRQDAGLYTARYNISNGYYYDCEVTYRAAPLVLDMEKSKNVQEGDSLDLACEVIGYPEPTVVWSIDGQIIDQNQSRIKMVLDYVTGHAHLSIASAQISDAGRYRCEATNGDGNKSSKMITVRVKGQLDWLWPVIAIICEAILLGIIIFACSKIKKGSLDDDPSADRKETNAPGHNRDHHKNQ